MSISSKGICLVISVWVKERRTFPCGKSLLQVQTLTSRFGIETFFIDTETTFCFYMDQYKITHYAVQEMYILNYKQGHQITIDFHLITHILGVYVGQMYSEQCKIYFQLHHWQTLHHINPLEKFLPY